MQMRGIFDGTGRKPVPESLPGKVTVQDNSVLWKGWDSAREVG